MKLNLKKINEHRNLLENHSLLVTNTIQTIEDLRVFMENHVFAVWDFMSLAKSLQHSIVPSGVIWVPTAENRSDAARIVNEIILCEETDLSIDGNSYISHFDLYKMAMIEIGADTSRIDDFIEQVKLHGLSARCFLHELDHLDGVRYTNLVKPLALKMARQKATKLVKKIIRQNKKQ